MRRGRSGDSRLASARASVESGQSRVLVQGGRVRADCLPDIPSVFEYLHMAPEPAHAEMVLEAWESLNDVGRMLVAPPSTPKARVDTLRAAAHSVLTNKAFVAQAKKRNREIDYIEAAEAKRMVQRVLSELSPAGKSRIKTVLLGKK